MSTQAVAGARAGRGREHPAPTLAPLIELTGVEKGSVDDRALRGVDLVGLAG